MRPSAAACSFGLVVVVVVAGCASTPSPGVPPRSTATTTALAVDSALVATVAIPLWPDFDPLTSPVAMFDGTRSYLFRHPSPPAGYVPVEGRSAAVVRVGRDPAITANTSALLGGVSTATVTIDPRQDARSLAALTVHELFHVFQRARHPSWQANEADLFTYPVEDAAALGLRREETFALASAMRASALDSVRCWARAFADVRGRRHSLVGQAAAAFERGTELNEGLAQYVERRAGGMPPALDPVDPPAGQVRQRAYAIGAAQAAVLDRIRPEWRETLERAPAQAMLPLDSVVGAAAAGAGSPACAATEVQRVRWRAEAAADIRALVADRRHARDAYLEQPGWRIVLEPGASPLFPQGFDPLNVTRLSETEILHSRFLRLQGPLGSVAVLGGSALTQGNPGQHPLFAGVRRVTIAGLGAPPSVRDSAGVVAVDAGGTSLRVHGVRVDTSGRTVRLSAP